MATTVPDCEDALLARLQAALPGVRVQIGLEADEVPDAEAVFVQGVDAHRRVVVAHQGQLVRETYTIPLLIEVRAPGSDRAPVRTRFWEIANAIYADIEAEPRIDGVVTELGADLPNVEHGPTENGWLFRATMNVTVAAIAGE